MCYGLQDDVTCGDCRTDDEYICAWSGAAHCDHQSHSARGEEERVYCPCASMRVGGTGCFEVSAYSALCLH